MPDVLLGRWLEEDFCQQRSSGDMPRGGRSRKNPWALWIKPLQESNNERKRKPSAKLKHLLLHAKNIIVQPSSSWHRFGSKWLSPRHLKASFENILSLESLISFHWTACQLGRPEEKIMMLGLCQTALLWKLLSWNWTLKTEWCFIQKHCRNKAQDH